MYNNISTEAYSRSLNAVNSYSFTNHDNNFQQQVPSYQIQRQDFYGDMNRRQTFVNNNMQGEKFRSAFSRQQSPEFQQMYQQRQQQGYSSKMHPSAFSSPFSSISSVRSDPPFNSTIQSLISTPPNMSTSHLISTAPIMSTPQLLSTPPIISAPPLISTPPLIATPPIVSDQPQPEVFQHKDQNDFRELSSLLFYGDRSPLVDPYAQESLYQPSFPYVQDTPPSSPDSEVSQSHSLYTSMAHENMMIQPIYNNPSVSIPSNMNASNMNTYDQQYCYSNTCYPQNYECNIPSAVQPSENMRNVENMMNVTSNENSYKEYKINEISENLKKRFFQLSPDNSRQNKQRPDDASTNALSSQPMFNGKTNGFYRTHSNPDFSFPSPKLRTLPKSNSVDECKLTLPCQQNVSSNQSATPKSNDDNQETQFDNPLDFTDPYSPESNKSEMTIKHEEEANGINDHLSDTEEYQKKKSTSKISKQQQIPTRSIRGGGVSKVKKPGKPRLFSFLLEKLKENNTCIEWVNESEGTFKFLDSKRIAHLWGLKKNKPNMQYENFARSLRTYIKKGILTKPRNKLVYRFANIPPN